MESSVQSIRESCEGAAARAVRRVQYAPGDLIGSKYVVVSRLAESTDAAVFVCCIAETGQQVAVHALLQPTTEGLRRLKAQFRALLPSAGSDLPRALALHVSDQEAFIVMELRERFDYGRVLAFVGRSGGERWASGVRPTPPSPSDVDPGLRLIGRGDVLAQLRAVSQRACQKEGSVAVLWGASGMGKTRLIHEIAREWAARGDWVLEGRCYPREFMPFASLDGAIDALRNQLTRLPRAQLFPLQQDDLSVLARAFPALDGLVGTPYHRARAEGERTVARVGEALRVMLERLVRDRPIALLVDDAHWGDEDGLRVLSRLWRAPLPRGLLVLVALRREGQVALELEQSVAPASWVENVTLPPLTRSACAELAREAGMLLEDDDAEMLETLGGGNPNWIIHLARASSEQRPRTVSEAVRKRLSEVGSGERELLEILAAARGPVPEAIARRATASSIDFAEVVDALKQRGLVTFHRTSRGDTALDVDHDSTRTELLNGMDPTHEQSLLGRLAQAVESERRASSSPIAEYHLGAGEPARAVDSALVAAARAREQLAFARAARLYDIALRHGCEEPTERARVLRHHGESLVAAGHGLAGAERILEAAQTHPEAPERMKLRALGIECLLRSAEHERALEELPPLLGAIGLSEQPWQPKLVFDLVAFRTRLWWLRRKSRRPASETPEDVQLRMDILWSLGVGLSLYDPLHAFTLQARHAVLAERYASSEHLSLSRATEAFILAWEGGAEKRRRGRRLMGAAEELARESDNARVRAHLFVMSAGISSVEERHADVLELTEQGLTFCNDFCPQARWEIAQLAALRATALLHSGRLPEMVDWVTGSLQEAESQEDRLARLLLRGGVCSLAWLASGQEERLEQELEAAETTPLRGYYRFQDLWSRAAVALAQGRVEAACRISEEAYRTYRSDFLFRLRSVRIDLLDLRARCALTLAARRGDGSLLKHAASCASALAREEGDWPAGLAATHRALLALHGGRLEEACDGLLEAHNCLTRSGMQFHAHAVQTRYAALVGRSLDPPDDWRTWLEVGGAEQLPRLIDAVVAPLSSKALP